MPSPREFADLAQTAYLTTDDFITQGLLSEIDFLSSGKGFYATTGSEKSFRTTSDFGFFARGSGNYKDHLFLVFRGTRMSSPHDIKTDLRASAVANDTGDLVHSGFQDAFNSLKGQLIEYLDQHKDANTIHCVGHSLGGALANLAAEWIKRKRTASEVSLYTFGAPRVGVGPHGFPGNLTISLDAKNIHRVANSQDPVTYVPLYPFGHAPLNGMSCYINDGNGIRLSAHKMDNYINSVSRARSWEELKAREPVPSFDMIKIWLDSKDNEFTGSAKFWIWVNFATYYLIRSINESTNVQLMSGMSIADYLAVVLAKGISLANSASEWVIKFLRKIARVVGFNIPNEEKNLTRSVISSLLNRVADMLEITVKQAIAIAA